MAIRALLEPLFKPKFFLVFALLVQFFLEDNAICARVLLGLLRQGFFLGDLLKISLGPPIALFKKMRVLGDLAKVAIIWSFGNFWSRFFAQKSSPVFALEVHTN